MKRKLKTNKTTQPIRSKADRDAMIRYFLKRSLRDYALFIFGIYTGRRISDLVALNVRDVAYIDRRGYFRIADRLEIWEKKTGKYATLRLHSRIKWALGKYLKERRKTAPSMEAVLEEPLFRSQKARIHDRQQFRITQQHAWRVLTDAAHACGLSYKIGTHSLRKTFGYMLYQKGKNIELIQDLLNHSSPEITLSYIGITQDDKDEAILSLD